MFLGRKQPHIVDGMSMQKMHDEITHAERVNAVRRRAELEMLGCAAAAVWVVVVVMWWMD